MSTKTNAMKNSHVGNNSRRHRHKKNAGFVTSLSPEAQINKVMADIANLNKGYNLKYWSASARKELAVHITVKLEVLHKGKPVDVTVPKLAFLAASPAFQVHMQGHPEDVHVRFIHQDVFKEAIEAIAKWLRKICSEKEYTEIPIPQNLEKALELRQTAQTLDMAQYVAHFTERYINGLGARYPGINEIKLVVKLTRDRFETDPMLEALANCLSFLVVYHEVDEDTEMAYANLLADKRFDRLLNAVNGDKVQAIEGHGWEVVYRRELAE
jgi:hypothetical protein